MFLISQSFRAVTHYNILCCTGQFLVDRIQKEGLEFGLSLAFVWNRNVDKLSGSVPKDLILAELSEFTHK